jgi:hypothetical protein
MFDRFPLLEIGGVPPAPCPDIAESGYRTYNDGYAL